MTLTNLVLSGDLFGVNADYADASGCEELKAVPTGKSCLYLTQLEISCVESIAITVGAGESTGACESVLIGPIDFSSYTGGLPLVLTFPAPIKLPAGKSLTIDADQAGQVQVLAFGFAR